MIRDAKFSDIPAMASLLRSSHERSKYAPRTGLNEKAIEQLLMSAVAGQKQSGPGGSFCQVAEKDGEVVGFMIGALGRVYNIGEKLSASDVFLVNGAKDLKITLRLIVNYMTWARNNPKVIEVGLSWSDALPSGKDIANIYKRQGAHLCGEQYEVLLDLVSEEAA